MLKYRLLDQFPAKAQKGNESQHLSSAIHIRRPSGFCLLPLVMCLLLSAFLLRSSAYAQSATATLTGTVVDQNGAVIPSANVAAVNAATALERRTTTNSSGEYTIPLLPPGTYVIRVEAPGFTPVKTRDIVLNVGDQKALTIQLKAGDISAAVQVTSETPLINQSPAVGTLVDRQFVGNLPLNGRSFQSLITLTPGVVLTKTTANDSGQFSVNGQRASANYFTVDGVSANVGISADSNLGQSTGGSLPGLSASGGTNNLVSVDALQEFKILTSTYAPEFGRTPGAQVSIITRSGTNDFHGTAFEYFRNDKLDANDWFANRSGLARPAERQNDFGGVFGGPIIENRTFFFFSYEGLRLRLPQTALTTVPSINARQTAPASMQPFLNAFPKPNGRNLLNNFSEFNATYSDPSTLNATSIRIDHTVNDKLTVFARYNYAPSETRQRGRASSLNTLNINVFKTQTLTGAVTLAISATISNDFRLNYSRNRGASFLLIDNFGEAVAPSDSVLFPPFAKSEDSSFVFSITGGTNSGYQTGKTSDNLQRQINLVDTLSAVTGSHQTKFGVDYRRLTPVFSPVQYSQQAFFNDVNTALTGRATSVFILAFSGERFPIFNNVSIFGQDTWRILPRLTLTYGMRWEYNPPPSERNGNEPFALTGLSNSSTIGLATRGTPLYKTTYDNFAPRVGLAYQLSQRKGRETVLRGGFGVFYDLGTDQAATGFGNSFPNRVSGFVPGSNTSSGVAFPLDPSLATPPSFSLNPPFNAIFAVDPNLKLPYTYQWNLAVEQSLGSTQTVTASYVAAVGRRLLRQEVIRNPNPNFTTIFATRNSATSDYQALQLQFQRRLSRGLQALASYTWSHSIDTASDEAFSAPLSRVSIDQERGSSSFDIRHAFNAGITYNLPSAFHRGFGNLILRDFSLDGIFTARSATPVNVVTGATGVGGFAGSVSVSRPDLIQGVPLYLPDPSVAGGRKINQAAFTTPVGRQGTLGRNALRGFPMWQMDLAVRRQFNLSERINLQLRAEFFNLFNHPNFGDPGANFNGTNALTNPQFGQSINMLGRSLGSGGISGGLNPLYQVGGPRSVQFALRLQF